ncbi:TPA: hypothetical protein U6I48_004936 [Klebsiella aerogenes]|nr:hypothetical protein [Klebsiella aerogenes]
MITIHCIKAIEACKKKKKTVRHIVIFWNKAAERAGLDDEYYIEHNDYHFYSHLETRLQHILSVLREAPSHSVTPDHRLSVDDKYALVKSLSERMAALISKYTMAKKSLSPEEKRGIFIRLYNISESMKEDDIFEDAISITRKYLGKDINLDFITSALTCPMDKPELNKSENRYGAST